MPDFGTPNTNLLSTEAMLQAKAKFDQCVADYNTALSTVRGTIKQIINAAWQGAAGPLQFEQLHLDWDKNIVGIVNIVETVGKAIGLTSQAFQDLDNQAASAQTEANAAAAAGGGGQPPTGFA